MNHIRYPKTPRLADVLQQDVYPQWKRHAVVVEEKVDGANLGVRWSPNGLVYQSRGHILQGGAREAQFAPVYAWGGSREAGLRSALGERRMAYGEWCFAKHRAFYDALPDLFIGFDVLDLETGEFLDTTARDEVFEEAGIVSVPRLFTGVFGKAPAYASFLGPSRFKTARWFEALHEEAGRVGHSDPLAETDDSRHMEGVYVRVESEGRVVGRMKLHRPGFEKVTSEGWGRGPFLRNRVRVV